MTRMEAFPCALLALSAALGFASPARAQQDSTQVEQRVQSILNQMTLDEKLSYIGGTGFWDIKPIPRLGLPQIFMENGPLGITHQPFEPTTRYPAGLAVAATWNRDRARGRGRQIGQDARARGFYADLGPGIDFYRTPLGGRDFEYSTGEDPCLGSQLVVPLVAAMQQQGVWANVKHYVCNDEEYRRENIDIEVEERALREIYLPPFEAAVLQGDAATVMAAFNSLNGAFCSQNPILDTQILKQEWGFDGILMSDYQSIKDGLLAAEAGMDLDMPNGMFMNSTTLLPHITGGQAPLIPLSTIDDKVRRLLRKIVSFGFLDRPQLDKSIPLDDPNSELEALHEAQEGIVLLKNDGNILPLKRDKVGSVAVLGRMAQGVPPTGFGSSFVKVLNYVSELSGIQYRAGGNVKVDFIDAGTPDPATAIWEFLDAGGFVEAGLQALYFNSNDLSGSPVVTRVDQEVNFDWTLAGTIPVSNKTTFSALWTGRVRPQYSGDHLFKVRADGGIRLYVNGQLLIDTFLSPMPPPVYGTTIPTYAEINLQAGQAYNVRLEYRRTSGFPGDSGSLQGVQFSWTPLVVPPSIRSYDAVVMCQGIDNEYDGEGLDLSFKFEDHGLAVLAEALILPEFQDELIQNVIAQNPRTIVVLHGPSNFDIQGWVNNVPGLIQAWYPGEYGGLALGEILFGDINPSGKLPITMEKHLQDNPTTANYPLTSDASTINYSEGIFVGYRGYDKSQNITPQFPFGYGLSYTTFTYSDLDIRPSKRKDDNSEEQPLAKVSFPASKLEDDNEEQDVVKVNFTVTNTGRRAGAEIAELYVAPVNPPVDRPIKELKGFQKVFLRSGQSTRVTLELDQRAFAFFNTTKNVWDAEPGTYKILVGGSSQDLPLSGSFVLKSELDSQP
jgi:beta-glucosidase